MKRKGLLILLLFVSLFVLVGCGEEDEASALIGTWKGLTDGETREQQIETVYTFKDGGKVEYSNEYGFNLSGNYTLDGNKVTIKLDTWEKERVYEFEIKDGKLTMKTDDVYLPSYTDMEKQEE